MEQFWLHGYEGTSMTDLTAAMKINSPSLYAAFGSKEQLFREAVAYYNDTEGAGGLTALKDAPTAAEGVAAFLRRNVTAFCDPGRPRGCMIVLSATTATDRTQEVHDHLSEWRLATERDFCERVQRGISDGDVPVGTDGRVVAAFYNTVNHGMALQARDGADLEKLSGIAEGAIAAWPAVIASAAT